MCVYYVHIYMYYIYIYIYIHIYILYIAYICSKSNLVENMNINSLKRKFCSYNCNSCNSGADS